jgi:hypothetical protein
LLIPLLLLAACSQRLPAALDASSTLAADDASQGANLHLDPFLKTYVAQLRAETPNESLDQIAEVGFDDLIRFHHGYGRWIRNKWLWGSREQALTGFFHQHGVDHPDEMSMVLIQALWQDLNSKLPPAEADRRETLRKTAAAKAEEILRIEADCTRFMYATKESFERCYDQYGLPSANPASRDPAYHLKVTKNGKVSEVVFFEGSSQKVQECLRPLLTAHTFPSFQQFDALTFGINYFRCRAAERD